MWSVSREWVKKRTLLVEVKEYESVITSCALVSKRFFEYT